MPNSDTELAPSNEQVLAAGYYQAMRLGLPREEAQDCAMDFVVHMLSMPMELSSAKSSAWLHRCAHNYACNFGRSLARRRKRESAWDDELLQELPTSGPGPKTQFIRKEMWNQVIVALQNLTPDQREMFVRHHLRDESVPDLAKRFKRTPHAVEECLSNIRRRLPSLLQHQGWTEDETRMLFGASRRPREQAARA